MKEFRILFDGRPLSHDPLGPAACHLFEILTSLPEGVRAYLAVPGGPPEWLPDRVETQLLPPLDPGTGRLSWEQRQVPALARRLRVDLLHLVGNGAPLFSDVPVLVSPAAYSERGPVAGLRDRLRAAMGRGGLARAQGILWPDSLPVPQEAGKFLSLPRRVHPSINPKQGISPPAFPGMGDLPGNFFLLHSTRIEITLRAALEAWTWAAGPVGDAQPLLWLGVPKAQIPRVEAEVRRYHLDETVIVLPEIPLSGLPDLYRAASAVFHPMEASPWGGPLPWGIACGLPVVGHERPLASALAGSAAYLVDPQNTRGLGAALISVVVKDTLRRQLQAAALERAKAWRAGTIGEELWKAYQTVLGI